MSILGSMYIGASGLGSHGKATDVVSDNIANANTVGFKAGRGRFEDVMGVVLSRSSSGGSAGLGSRLAGVEQMFTQGALLGSSVSTDMAIEGGGFFIVKGLLDGQNGSFYTRAGQFTLDNTGALVDPNGLTVQGYMADSSGQMGTSLTDIIFAANQTVQPQASTLVNAGLNLDSTSIVPAVFDPINPDTTSNFSTSVTVYDSLGASHKVDVFFRKSALGTWDWHAMVDGGEVTVDMNNAATVAGTPAEIASGTITFNPNGALLTEVQNPSTAVGGGVNFLGAAPGQLVAFDFGDSITTDGGTGLSGATQYASSSAVRSLQQNGYPTGVLAGVTVGSDGIISGTFGNGENRVVGRVALATFQNNNGLMRAGSSLFMESPDSGIALVGAAGTGGRGSVIGSSLEQSNVDMAQEFVNLIAFQRGFQSSSRTISTADEMLQELVNLKR